MLTLATNPASSSFPAKQTKDALGYFRSYHTVETPSATILPNPPAPSVGARTFASSPPSSSSSSSSSWRFPSFISKNAPVLGAALALASGALYYYGNGTADCRDDTGIADGEDTKKTSIKEVDMPFFNRVSELVKLNTDLDGAPGVIQVFVGPKSSGKTVRSFFLQFSQRMHPVVGTDDKFHFTRPNRVQLGYMFLP